jgi:hypothetical protein
MANAAANKVLAAKSLKIICLGVIDAGSDASTSPLVEFFMRLMK